jgi:hypothetical protein
MKILILYKTGEESTMLPAQTLIPNVFAISVQGKHKQQIDTLIQAKLADVIPTLEGNTVAYYGEQARTILTLLHSNGRNI